MINKQNLKYITSTDEAKRLGRIGGKKSAESRRRKRDFQEAVDMCLSAKTPEHMRKKIAEAFPELAKKGLDLQTATILSMINLSMSNGKGAVAAAQFLRDTVGEKPKDKVEVGNLDSTPFVIKIVK